MQPSWSAQPVWSAAAEEEEEAAEAAAKAEAAAAEEAAWQQMIASRPGGQMIGDGVYAVGVVAAAEHAPQLTRSLSTASYDKMLVQCTCNQPAFPLSRTHRSQVPHTLRTRTGQPEPDGCPADQAHEHAAAPAGQRELRINWSATQACAPLALALRCRWPPQCP